MTEVERLTAEVEALKCVCAVLVMGLPTARRSELTATVVAGARTYAATMNASFLTDDQIERFKFVLGALADASPREFD